MKSSPIGGGAPTSDQIKQTVTQDTFAVTAQTPVATDGYVMLALDLNTQINRIISTGAQSQDPGFSQSANGKLLILTRYSFGNSVVKLTDATIAAQPELHIMPSGTATESAAGIFVYNGGGLGNHIAYENAAGDNWVIWDIGTDAAMWPLVKYTPFENAFVNVGFSDFVIYSTAGTNAIGCRADNGMGLEQLYATNTGAATDHIVQGTGSDITFKPYDPTGQQNNPLRQFWLQIYENENPATPIYKRFEHNAGGGQLPFPVKIDVFTTNYTGQEELSGSIVVWPNVNAATDGKPVRDSNGFIADIAADSTIGIDPTFAPNSLTKL